MNWIRACDANGTFLAWEIQMPVGYVFVVTDHRNRWIYCRYDGKATIGPFETDDHAKSAVMNNKNFQS